VRRKTSKLGLALPFLGIERIFFCNFLVVNPWSIGLYYSVQLKDRAGLFRDYGSELSHLQEPCIIETVLGYAREVLAIDFFNPSVFMG
jgi:hypothetical protein